MMLYWATGERMLAVVAKVSVKVSPSLWPVTLPVKTGFTVPYRRVKLLASTVRTASVTVSDTVFVVPVKSCVSVGVKVTDSS